MPWTSTLAFRDSMHVQRYAVCGLDCEPGHCGVSVGVGVEALDVGAVYGDPELLR